MTLLPSVCKAALAFFGYLGIHYACAFILPLPSAGYTVCANLTAVAVSAAVFLLQGRSALSYAGVRALPWQKVLAAVGVGVGFCLLIRLVMLTVPFPESWNSAYADRVNAVSRTSPPWLLYLSTIVVAPLAEEWVFRGLVLRVLKNGMPRPVAVLLCSAAFAALHGTVVWMLYTFVLGLLLCVLLECTHSLWACIACHAAFNVMGQIPFIGILPEAAVIAVFAVGILMFVCTLGWLLFPKRTQEL